MQFAIDHLPDAAYCAQEDARTICANAAATQMLGSTRE
jgi:hypothetical protein